jgi:hypothetical protein
VRLSKWSPGNVAVLDYLSDASDSAELPKDGGGRRTDRNCCFRTHDLSMKDHSSQSAKREAG